MPVEVIVDSSPCSTTCGLGVKTQTLCLLKDGKTAMEEGMRSKDGAEVSQRHLKDLNKVLKMNIRREIAQTLLTIMWKWLR